MQGNSGVHNYFQSAIIYFFWEKNAWKDMVHVMRPEC